MIRKAFLQLKSRRLLKTLIITSLFILLPSAVSHSQSAGSLNDVATAMAMDGSGNVYVTGFSSDPQSGADYFTAKYDASGAIVWTAHYNGEENGDDVANAIYVDAAGNVYVTGTSRGAGTGPDYATVKYNADGAQEWVARYNGPGNDLDEARALAVDASGNVYVTGFSLGVGTSKDYATVKYNADGIEQWVVRYNGPGNDLDKAAALAIDADGNVYVTGFSIGAGTSRDYATIKYAPDGAQAWVARYDGPEHSIDDATAIAVDSSGSIYVTGSSAGQGTSTDYATIKYSAGGVEQWVARYNGPGNSTDGAVALAVDASGNIYVTGTSEGVSTSADYATVKYNADGVEQWVARYNGPGNDSDMAAALTVDASGNVYVTGTSEGVSTSADYATVKYNAEGTELWAARYNGPGNDVDQAAALAVDDSGNVYVTGHSVGSDQSEDYATVKYTPDGVQAWVIRYEGAGR